MKIPTTFSLALLAALVQSTALGANEVPPPKDNVPVWSESAVWYQIFPERFRNADPSNDPTREDLEIPHVPGSNWKISDWTADWYARDEWEKALGVDFYENGVFHRRYGGDLQGVLDKLDYLRDLGVTAIYFNPVFYGRSLHKYDGNSFHHIDPHFGPDPKGDLEIIRNGGETADPKTWKWTAADKLFLKLVKEAHARGIRVVVDGVFNHSGRDFFAFRDLRKKQEKSDYVDWYYVESFDDADTRRNEFRYRGWAGFGTLPEFRNTEDGTDLHPKVKQYIFDATTRWMDPDGDGDPSDGIDGWRLDVAEELPVKFWADWNAHVRKVNPQAYTVAEVWNDAAHFIKDGGFSASMNYYGFAVPVKAWLVDNSIKPSEFGKMLADRKAALPVPVQLAMQNLVDSHDTDRITQMIVNRNTTGQYKNKEKFDYDEPGNSARSNMDYQLRKPNDEERRLQRLVALMQVTYVGAPMFYYGTEAGMWGGDDPDCRKPMVWQDLKYAVEALDPRGRPRPADDNNFDPEIFGFFQQAIQLHKDNAGLRSPDFAVVAADDAANVLTFSRGREADLRLVSLNRSNQPQTVQIPLGGLPSGVKGEVLFASSGSVKEVKVAKKGNALEVTLPALTGVVVR